MATRKVSLRDNRSTTSAQRVTTVITGNADKLLEPGEMFEIDDSERALIDSGIAVDLAALRPQWLKTVSGVVSEATLALPRSDWMQRGGRSGRHSEHLGHLLSELQSMQRTFPGATW